YKRNSVGKLNVSRRRHQREGGSLEVGESGDSYIGDAVIVLAATIQLRELEPVSASLPCVAVRRNVLRCPTCIGAHFIHNVRCWQPCFRNEEAFAGAVTNRGRCRQIRTGKGSERIDQAVV